MRQALSESANGCSLHGITPPCVAPYYPIITDQRTRMLVFTGWKGCYRLSRLLGERRASGGEVGKQAS